MGRVVPVTQCCMVLYRHIPAESPSATWPSAVGKTSRSILAFRAATRTAMQSRPSRRCHTERKTDLDARNHGMSGAKTTIGPDLPERVEQVRAALP
jgi:hypothetical protein